MHPAMLSEIKNQAKEIYSHIDFLRENAGRPPFQDKSASLSELIELRKNLTDDLKEAADWHIPIYIGQSIIDELDGCWEIDKRKSSAMLGKVYVGGFGNIEYENIYLWQLTLQNNEDLKRINKLIKQAHKAYGLLDKFKKEFHIFEGISLSKTEIENKCIKVGILPDPQKYKMQYKVEKKRVVNYSKILKIELT